MSGFTMAILICAGIAVFGVGLIFFVRRHQSAGESVARMAGQAVERARVEYGLDLDYTPGSLRLLDQIFEQERPAAYAANWGAYVGETLRRQFGGDWGEAGGEPVLRTRGRVIAPADWIREGYDLQEALRLLSAGGAA